jgi:hypothetical protein
LLVNERLAEARAAAEAETITAVSRLLQQLPQLAVLKLPHSMHLQKAAVEHIAVMSAICQLVHFCQDVSADCLGKLPSSITQLHVAAAQGAFRAPGITLASQLQHMTAVVDLELAAFSVPPLALAPLQQLLRLSLVACRLLPSKDAGPSALLELVASPTALQSLQLDVNELSTVQLPPQRFSALTASSNLTELCVCPALAAPVPLGAAEHMFPAGKQLSQLQGVSLSTNAFPKCVDGASSDDEDFPIVEGWLERSDLQRIFCSCPALQSLQIIGAVHDSYQSQGEIQDVLLQLPSSCTSLGIGGDACGDDWAGVVAQLTHLEDLLWDDALDLTDEGVQKLTALTRLTKLHVTGGGLSEELAPEDELCLQQFPGEVRAYQQFDVKIGVWQQLGVL